MRGEKNNNNQQKHGDVKDVEEAEESGKRVERRPFDLERRMTRQAAGGFITQPGCVVPTLILGPELWVMNIPCDKWGNRNS